MPSSLLDVAHGCAVRVELEVRTRKGEMSRGIADPNVYCLSKLSTRHLLLNLNLHGARLCSSLIRRQAARAACAAARRGIVPSKEGGARLRAHTVHDRAREASQWQLIGKRRRLLQKEAAVLA